MESGTIKGDGFATFCRLVAIEALYQTERDVRAQARELLSRRDFSQNPRMMVVDLFGLVVLAQGGARLTFVMQGAQPPTSRILTS